MPRPTPEQETREQTDEVLEPATGRLHSALRDFVRSTHTCLLLVHPDVARLDRAAAEALSTYGWPHLSVGRELSAALLPELASRRPRRARLWLADRLGSMTPGPVLCTETDLLFEPTLQLDPLTLLASASRVCRLVVAWPGQWHADTLTYAVPDHRHYRAWRKPEVAVVHLD